MCIFWTWLTFVGELVPAWSCRWARRTCACCSIDHRFVSRTCFTHFVDWIPSRFIFWTHTYTCTSLVTWFNWSETDTLISFLIKLIPSRTSTNPFAKRKDRPFRTSKASVINFIRIGCLYRTCSGVKFGCFRKHYQPVLLFSDISVNPVWRLEIILVKSVIQINQSSRCLRVDYSWHSFAVPVHVIFHNCEVKFSSCYLVNKLIRYCALVGWFVCTLFDLRLHVDQRLIGDFYLLVQISFLLFRQIGFLTGFWSKWLIEKVLNIIKRVSFICQSFLKLHDLVCIVTLVFGYGGIQLINLLLNVFHFIIKLSLSFCQFISILSWIILRRELMLLRQWHLLRAKKVQAQYS